jgi:hypothetical protein
MKKYYLTILSIFILGFFLISSCQNDKVCNCPTDVVMQKSNDSICLAVNEQWREAKRWEKYNEPYLDSIQYQAYRFYLRNSFEEFTKIVRIEEEENGYHQLTIKTYCDSYPFSIENGAIPFENTIRTLSIKEWDEIRNTINQNCFWTTDTGINKSSGCLNCGGYSFIEGNNPKIQCSNITPYHISTDSCGRDSLTDYKYWQICDMLLELDK